MAEHDGMMIASAPPPPLIALSEQRCIDLIFVSISVF